MATFHFELVSPDKISFSGEVDQVDVPGSEGDFGVLAGHAPLVATLRPGILTMFSEGDFGVLAGHAPIVSALRPGIMIVHVGGQGQRMIVLGGFADTTPNRLTILAERAIDMKKLDRQMLAVEKGKKLAAEAA